VPIKIREVIKGWKRQAGATCELLAITACSAILTAEQL